MGMIPDIATIRDRVEQTYKMHLANAKSDFERSYQKCSLSFQKVFQWYSRDGLDRFTNHWRNFEMAYLAPSGSRNAARSFGSHDRIV